MGFPNIAIVVGSSATLVVDTGMGPKNGATAARVAAKLAPNNHKLFLTTTHFHPEHAAGEPGFPPSTILIRNTRAAAGNGEARAGDDRHVQPEFGQNKELLAGVVLRQPDVTVRSGSHVDLGGVTARLIWFGEAHTKGDELTFVEPDRTLISGDVVQNKTIPMIFGDGGTPSTWLAVLDKVAGLNAAHVLPDHSAPGDGSLVGAEQKLISEIRTRALALKRQGVSADDAGKQVSAGSKNAASRLAQHQRRGIRQKRLYGPALETASEFAQPVATPSATRRSTVPTRDSLRTSGRRVRSRIILITDFGFFDSATASRMPFAAPVSPSPAAPNTGNDELLAM